MNGPYLKKKHKTVWSVQVTGYHACLIMERFKPFLHERRQRQIDETILWQLLDKFKIE